MCQKELALEIATPQQGFLINLSILGWYNGIGIYQNLFVFKKRKKIQDCCFNLHGVQGLRKCLKGKSNQDHGSRGK